MTLRETLSEAKQDDIINIDGLDYQVLRVSDDIAYLEGYDGHTLKATLTIDEIDSERLTVNREVTIELVNPEVA